MIKILLKIAEKKDFVIDKSVNSYYIIRICSKYGFMLLRGCWLSWLYKIIRFPFFKGKNVYLIVKKKISVGKKTKIYFGTKIENNGWIDAGMNFFRWFHDWNRVVTKEKV